MLQTLSLLFEVDFIKKYILKTNLMKSILRTEAELPREVTQDMIDRSNDIAAYCEEPPTKSIRDLRTLYIAHGDQIAKTATAMELFYSNNKLLIQQTSLRMKEAASELKALESDWLERKRKVDSLLSDMLNQIKKDPTLKHHEEAAQQYLLNRAAANQDKYSPFIPFAMDASLKSEMQQGKLSLPTRDSIIGKRRFNPIAKIDRFFYGVRSVVGLAKKQSLNRAASILTAIPHICLHIISKIIINSVAIGLGTAKVEPKKSSFQITSEAANTKLANPFGTVARVKQQLEHCDTPKKPSREPGIEFAKAKPPTQRDEWLASFVKPSQFLNDGIQENHFVAPPSPPKVSRRR